MKNTYFLPLGGTGEIGMNLNLYGYGEGKEIDWFMVDCGVTFSQAGLPGIDLQMPDPTFIASQKEKLMGIILTQPDDTEPTDPKHHRPTTHNAPKGAKEITLQRIKPDTISFTKRTFACTW